MPEWLIATSGSVAIIVGLGFWCYAMQKARGKR